MAVITRYQRKARAVAVIEAWWKKQLRKICFGDDFWEPLMQEDHFWARISHISPFGDNKMWRAQVYQANKMINDQNKERIHEVYRKGLTNMRNDLARAMLHY